MPCYVDLTKTRSRRCLTYCKLGKDLRRSVLRGLLEPVNPFDLHFFPVSLAASGRVDNIRHSLVGLKMPRALEMLDATLRRIEQGQIDGIEALDELLLEELSLRENRRIKAALRMARLPVVKTLAGFDFSFQPSRDCQDFRVWAGMMGAKESRDVPKERASDSGRAA